MCARAHADARSASAHRSVVGIPTCESLIQLQPGHSYTIYVRALNVGGTSARSEPATVHTTGLCPSHILLGPKISHCVTDSVLPRMHQKKTNYHTVGRSGIDGASGSSKPLLFINEGLSPKELVLAETVLELKAFPHAPQGPEADPLDLGGLYTSYLTKKWFGWLVDWFCVLR